MGHVQRYIPYLRLSGFLFLIAALSVIITNTVIWLDPQNFGAFRLFILSNLLQFGWAGLGVFALYRVLRHTRAGFFYDISLLLSVVVLVIWGIAYGTVIIFPPSFSEQVQQFESKRFTSNDGIQQIMFGALIFALFWLGVSLGISNVLRRIGFFTAALTLIILGLMAFKILVSPVMIASALIPIGLGLLIRRVQSSPTISPHLSSIGEFPN
ncbi:MAG: hypothetical protein KIH69_009940 [Anaerolineae bacterium]|nr:hypothetical protein [Anaerolineae bacterium]